MSIHFNEYANMAILKNLDHHFNLPHSDSELQTNMYIYLAKFEMKFSRFKTQK